MDYPDLFKPPRIKQLRLNNRIVVPPMLQLRPITSAEGIAWYRRLAAGGAGLVIVEGTVETGIESGARAGGRRTR